MDFKQDSQIAQIEKIKKSLINNKSDISLSSILSSKPCQDIFNNCRKFRSRVYTPMKTVFTFIKQVLNPDKSCKKAVAGAVVENIIASKKKISSNTGPYCKARNRLPEEAVKALVKETGVSATKNLPQGWKPYGRELKVFDGT